MFPDIIYSIQGKAPLPITDGLAFEQGPWKEAVSLHWVQGCQLPGRQAWAASGDARSWRKIRDRTQCLWWCLAARFASSQGSDGCFSPLGVTGIPGGDPPPGCEIMSEPSLLPGTQRARNHCSSQSPGSGLGRPGHFCRPEQDLPQRKGKRPH